MGDLVRSIGIIGVSEGNGHPFSYSSIINGYSPEGLANSGWLGIYDYVRQRHGSEFGLGEWRITHAWTQDPAITRKLCTACRIEHCAEDYRDFLGNVDAVIIARDDFETHFEMSRPFLEAGLPVFIDKPLGVEVRELQFYKPFLQSGKLMSCSGMRYARELDEPRANLGTFGHIKLIRGAIVRNWENYGVHLLEAIFGMISVRPVSVQSLGCDHASMIVRLDGGAVLQIDALGESPRAFHLEIFGSERLGTYDIVDNFSMFRRMLWEFLRSVETGLPALPADQTLDVMRTLIAGRVASREKREVLIDDIVI